MRARRLPLLLYVAALGVTGLAVALRVLLDPIWGSAAPFVTLFPAVMVSAWIGGLGPGLLAVAAAAVAADYFWLAPYRAFGPLHLGEAVQLSVFVVVSVGMVLVTEAVTRARGRLDALLDASPIGLGFHDASLRYIRVNRALAEINGRPAAEHVGRTGREILGAAAADAVAPVMHDVLRTGRAMHVPALRVALSATGAERWYRVSCAPVRDAAGRVSGVAVSVGDVTETQQAQDALAHERELLQTLIDTIPVMIAMDERGTGALRVNREFERVTGWTAAEAAAGDILAGSHPDPASTTPGEKVSVTAPGWRDLQLTTKSGRVVETSWAMVRLSDDSRVGIGLDVTDRKRYEAEMRGARAAAETANRAKDEFIAMLGHELRNPLSAIAGAVAVLQRVGGAEETPAAAASDVIARQTQHLARLMDDLLDVGRVMTGKIVLDRRPLDLLESARRVEATVRATGRAARHRLSVAGTPAWIDGDVTRIEQVITNLVTNALKYTPPGGVIGVTVGDDGHEAVVRVSDTGPGIPSELLPRIFDLFVQGEQAAERAQGGLGIGLTLVRRLVELHGGRVDAASGGAGTGATFTVSFPFLPAPPPAPDAPRRRRVPPQRTLIVEDNDDAREMLRTLLELDGHTVWEAANGIAGLAAALEHRPDVAVIDIGLPEMDGYEMARKVRASASLKTVKLIALTGYGQAEDARRALEAGFDVHIVKPVDPERLADAVATVVDGGDGARRSPGTFA